MNFLKELSIEDQVTIHEKNESEEATVLALQKKIKPACLAIELVKKNSFQNFLNLIKYF
jgi:hypothetical protein